ncbi:hypothetical protein BCR41DRAFT_109273 [Lobosporangium transversale]|uniref:Uncharacterized protein n=1 Tax=Lobosporangium transversale TaxID=64571 RepID=A0A1Y2GH78_9FUNG|nr:hypothetical protein BCR41DRAFT_113979 [Lobosporangium transversale]XP_021879854.1 hypothetical protein BCR41DRAFT_109273 [Lobosporangium transversale]ORZ10937.1 hypothetical protein BCR41DRAFT_113979 [Lobosporangium transversale]ORZ11757.1 hypothetical protein BCR41DRAFT_109273 [Lobosporangium transversale]|eukprot:XP_021879454.1 hypothetical protein BCR41DRAFT_113979 [Lobosporangium transversale]
MSHLHARNLLHTHRRSLTAISPNIHKIFLAVRPCRRPHTSSHQGYDVPGDIVTKVPMVAIKVLDMDMYLILIRTRTRVQVLEVLILILNHSPAIHLCTHTSINSTISLPRLTLSHLALSRHIWVTTITPLRPHHLISPLILLDPIVAIIIMDHRIIINHHRRHLRTTILNSNNSILCIKVLLPQWKNVVSIQPPFLYDIVHK